MEWGSLLSGGCDSGYLPAGLRPARSAAQPELTGCLLIGEAQGKSRGDLLGLRALCDALIALIREKAVWTYRPVNDLRATSKAWL